MWSLHSINLCRHRAIATTATLILILHSIWHDVQQAVVGFEFYRYKHNGNVAEMPMQLSRKFVMLLNDLWERSPYGFNPAAGIVSRNWSSTCLSINVHDTSHYPWVRLHKRGGKPYNDTRWHNLKKLQNNNKQLVSLMKCTDWQHDNARCHKRRGAVVSYNTRIIWPNRMHLFTKCCYRRSSPWRPPSNYTQSV